MVYIRHKLHFAENTKFENINKYNYKQGNINIKSNGIFAIYTYFICKINYQKYYL